MSNARKSSNINFSWIKIEYQNNLNPKTFFLPLLKAKDVIICDNTNNNFLSEPEKMNFKVYK